MTTTMRSFQQHLANFRPGVRLGPTPQPVTPHNSLSIHRVWLKVQVLHPVCYTGLMHRWSQRGTFLRRGPYQNPSVTAEPLRALPHSLTPHVQWSVLPYPLTDVSVPVWGLSQTSQRQNAHTVTTTLPGALPEPLHWGWHHPIQWQGLTKPPSVLPELTNWNKQKQKQTGGYIPDRNQLVFVFKLRTEWSGVPGSDLCWIYSDLRCVQCLKLLKGHETVSVTVWSWVHL